MERKADPRAADEAKPAPQADFPLWLYVRLKSWVKFFIIYFIYFRLEVILAAQLPLNFISATLRIPLNTKITLKIIIVNNVTNIFITYF